MTNPNISVVMAAFNGARYISQQLQSFAQQELLPDEVVVSDDGSTDDTIAIVKAFAQTSPFSIRLLQNSENVGFAKNFERALSAAVGDIIFFSDQDDVWYPEKIKCVLGVFLARPDIHLVINDQRITDSDLVPNGETVLGNVRKLGVSDSWFVAGCCTAITRDLRDIAVPFPRAVAAHDSWIHRIAEELDVRYVDDRVMQYYRRHGNNASNSLAMDLTRIDRYRHFRFHPVASSLMQTRAEYKLILSSLNEKKSSVLSPELVAKKSSKLKQKIDFLSVRLVIVLKPRYQRLWVLLCGGAGAYFGGRKFLTLFKDVLRPSEMLISGREPGAKVTDA